MALRDQPYFPLYVQDYLTDEKLNSCSAATQGVYIKVLCIFHKCDPYGGILFKQKDKQKSSICQNFAYKLAKLLPFDYDTILEAVTELIDEKVLTVDGDFIFQKRMVQDFNTSEARSKAGKKGGGNPNLLKQKSKQQFKQKPKQNTEYENENENEGVIEINKKSAHPEFKNCMDVYFDFAKQRIGAPPKILVQDGKALNEIIDYLQKFPNAQNGSKSVKELWEYILKSFDHWDKFYKSQIKLTQISSNILNIINNLKNGQSTNTISEQKFGRFSGGDSTEFLGRGKIAPLD